MGYHIKGPTTVKLAETGFDWKIVNGLSIFLGYGKINPHPRAQIGSSIIKIIRTPALSTTTPAAHSPRIYIMAMEQFSQRPREFYLHLLVRGIVVL